MKEGSLKKGVKWELGLAGVERGKGVLKIGGRAARSGSIQVPVWGAQAGRHISMVSGRIYERENQPR